MFALFQVYWVDPGWTKASLVPPCYQNLATQTQYTKNDYKRSETAFSKSSDKSLVLKLS